MGIAASVILLTVLFGGALLLHNRQAPGLVQVPFSDLLRDLDRGVVADVVVSGDILDFKRRDGHAFRTVAPANYVTTNVAFVPDLAKKGVRIDVQTASEQSAFSYGALLIGVAFLGLLGFTLFRV